MNVSAFLQKSTYGITATLPAYEYSRKADDYSRLTSLRPITLTFKKFDLETMI